MPFGKDDRRLSEMGLKMPSKIDDDFMRSLLWGFMFLLYEDESAG